VNASTHGGQVFAAARLQGVPPDSILDFSANINPLGPSPKALRRLRRDLSLIRFYPDVENKELRDVVANQVAVNGDCILFGNGATALLHLIPRVLKPRAAVVLEPGFSEYSAALERASCRIARLRLRPEAGFQLDRAALFEALRRTRPDFLVLGNPNNPTGTVLPPPLLSELISVCSQRRIHLVLDESFIDFTPYPSRVADAAKRSHVLVVRSLTKFWALAGVRIGYLVARKALVEKLSASSEPWSINTLASAAAAESLRDLKYRDRTLRLIRRERTFLIKQLAQLAWLETYPSETNFLLVRITAPGITSTHLRERLQERNILIRDGSSFPGLGRRHFRIAIRGRSDNQRLIDELHVISGDAVLRARESA
jgi:threonine-phosphate decarboxylase